MQRINQGARYRQLGAELRKRREEAGLSGIELAKRSGWSRSMVSRIETGQTAIDPVDAVQYLGYCGITRGQARDVMQLSRDALSHWGYWLSPHGEWLEDSLSALIYHESTAVKSVTYEPLLVPGLLQTEDYARTRISAERWRIQENVEECVRIRMERQQILDLPYPAGFEFFVHEQALRLEVGSPAVMHEQMLKLVLVAALAHVIVRVVPLSAGERAEFGGPFRLFEYREYPPLVYMHAPANGFFVEDEEYVASFRQLVPAISEVALDEGQSRKLIATLASEYDQRSERDADDLEEEQL